MKYVEKKTLANRDAINPMPAEDVEGILLVAEGCVLSWESGHSRYGYDSCSLYPAVQEGKRAWLVRKSWCATWGYCASGSVEYIIPYEDGIKLLIENGRFSFPIPNEPSEDERVRDGVAEHRHGGYGYFHAKDRVHL